MIKVMEFDLGRYFCLIKVGPMQSHKSLKAKNLFQLGQKKKRKRDLKHERDSVHQ